MATGATSEGAKTGTATKEAHNGRPLPPAALLPANSPIGCASTSRATCGEARTLTRRRGLATECDGLLLATPGTTEIDSAGLLGGEDAV